MSLFDKLKSGFQRVTGTEKMETAQDPATNRLISALEATSQGKGPSLVGEQARQAQSDATGNTVGAIRSSGGMSQALKTKMAARAQEGTGSRIARDETLGKLKERQDAQKTLASTLMGTRGQDVDAEMQRKKSKGSLFGKVLSGASSAMGMGAG